MDFAAAIQAEAGSNPMGQGAVPLLHSRLLLVDGDALAYATAGNDDTPIGVARRNLLDKIAHAQAVSGAGAVKILTTAPSSHKGFRFAVARVKPYQGHRKNSRRPKNWAALRTMLETGVIPNVELTTTAEADDLFGKYSTIAGPGNVVIYTEDKDMRMVPGWHLDWDTHTMHYVGPEVWDVTYNDKAFGRKWFWTQMLQGDSADNIPGLPRFNGALMGPKTAAKYLAGLNEPHTVGFVTAAYEQTYRERWPVEMLEQGILLWMRRDPYSNLWDVTHEHGPLGFAAVPEAVDEIKQRIKESL